MRCCWAWKKFSRIERDVRLGQLGRPREAQLEEPVAGAVLGERFELQQALLAPWRPGALLLLRRHRHQERRLVPSLLVQLEAFAEDRARDRFLELSLKPADGPGRAATSTSSSRTSSTRSGSA